MSHSVTSSFSRLFLLTLRFKLMDQLPQLFSRLHASPPGLAERELQPVHVSRRNYFRSKSGRSLYVAICNMHQHISQNPDWSETPPAPSAGSSASCRPAAASGEAAPSPPPKAHCSSASSPPEQRFDSGLVLNEVVVKTPPSLLHAGRGALGKNVLLLAPGTSSRTSSGEAPGPSRSPSGPPGLCPSPELPHCPLALQEETSR